MWGIILSKGMATFGFKVKKKAVITGGIYSLMYSSSRNVFAFLKDVGTE